MQIRPIFLLMVTLSLAASVTLPARAAEYSLMIYETRPELTARTQTSEKDAYWGRYNVLAKKLVDAGVLRGGTALDENSASLVRNGKVNSANPERDGAYLSGYFIIDVPTREAAEHWAAQVDTHGFVEVRPHRPNPTMPQAKH